MSVQQLKAAATGQVSAEQAKNPYEALKHQLERSKAEFMPLLGTASNVDRFVRVVLNAVLANPDLLSADRRSLIASCMKAAQDGLMPDGRDAVLNIYSTNVARRDQPPQWVQMVQYLPMTQGLIKKLWESGEITYLDAACVFEGDKFVYRRGDAPVLEHEPTLVGEPGAIIAAYAVVKLKNGETKREVMPKRDLDAVKAASKATSASSPWAKWPDQMSIKSVLKRVYKQLPRADAFEQVDRSDNEALGFAATASSVAEISAREIPPPAPPAVTHDPGQTFDFTPAGDDREREPVGQQTEQRKERAPAEAEQAGQQPAATAPRRPRQQAAAPAPKPAAQSYAQFVDRIRAASDRDTASLVLDEARDMLPADQQADLVEFWRTTWPE